MRGGNDGDSGEVENMSDSAEITNMVVAGNRNRDLFGIRKGRVEDEAVIA